MQVIRFRQTGIFDRDNGILVTYILKSLGYKCDNRLQAETFGGDSMICKYDPNGHQIYKASTAPAR